MTATQLEILNKKVWFDTKEVVAYTGFCRKTIIKYRNEGTNPGHDKNFFLPANRIGKRAYRYKKTEIDKFLLQHKQ